MTDSPGLVNIADVHTEAMQITAGDIRSTDLVFDITGDRHAIRSLRHGKRSVSFCREDQPEIRDRFLNDETITVVRSNR